MSNDTKNLDIEAACASLTVAVMRLVEIIRSHNSKYAKSAVNDAILGNKYKAGRCYIARPHLSKVDFNNPLFQKRWQPGIEVAIYFAGCPGVHNLAKILERPLFKIGCADPARLRLRLFELNADRWAGATAGSSVVYDGFDDWALQLLEQDTPVSPGSPVRIERRDIRVILPLGMTLRSFDRALGKALDSMSLERWVGSSDGQATIKRKALDPALFDRTTLYSFGTSVRTSKARELMLVRPRADLPIIVRLIEEMLFEAVRAGPVASELAS